MHSQTKAGVTRRSPRRASISSTAKQAASDRKHYTPDRLLQTYCERVSTYTSNQYTKIEALGQEMQSKLTAIDRHLQHILEALREAELEALEFVRAQDAARSSVEEHQADVDAMLALAKSQLDDELFAELLDKVTKEKSLKMSVDPNENVSLFLLNNANPSSLSNLVLQLLAAVGRFQEPDRTWFSWHSGVFDQHRTSTGSAINNPGHPCAAPDSFSLDRADSISPLHSLSSSPAGMDSATVSGRSTPEPDQEGFEESG